MGVMEGDLTGQSGHKFLTGQVGPGGQSRPRPISSLVKGFKPVLSIVLVVLVHLGERL